MRLMIKNLFYFTFFVSSFFLFAEETSMELSQLNRSDTLPLDSMNGMPDPYFEGYVQALIDVHFSEQRVIALVKNRDVWLSNLPKNKLYANSIISFVKDIPGVRAVKMINGMTPKEVQTREKYVNRPQIHGIWFPQTTELFLPMIANPRQVVYSIGYRGGDKICGKTAIPVSMGDDFGIFRWLDVLPWHGDLQIGIEAGIWSVFDVHVKGYNPSGGTVLVNTDFYVGIPLTYAINEWSFRFRIYHISSHLGDEFLVNHPGFVRLNPSFEALDFFTSYQASEAFRFYFGPGVILRSDDSFPMKRFYAETGMEVRFGGQKMYYHRLYGTFFLAAHLRFWQRLDFVPDGTYAFGYEWSKLQGVGRKIRLMAEFHHGYSLEGQFFRKHTQYGSLKFAYGF